MSGFRVRMKQALRGTGERPNTSTLPNENDAVAVKNRPADVVPVVKVKKLPAMPTAGIGEVKTYVPAAEGMRPFSAAADLFNDGTNRTQSVIGNNASGKVTRKRKADDDEEVSAAELVRQLQEAVSHS